jgi:hypothetical protein
MSKTVCPDYGYSSCEERCEDIGARFSERRAEGADAERVDSGAEFEAACLERCKLYERWHDEWQRARN